MKNNKFFKFLSTVLVAILIISIAPMNDAVANEMKSSADGIIKNAVDIAAAREAEMIAEAKTKAEAIVKKAEDEAVLEKKKAEADIKREIVDVSTLLTEKILVREISEDDHKKLIDSVIDNIGAE